MSAKAVVLSVAFSALTCASLMSQVNSIGVTATVTATVDHVVPTSELGGVVVGPLHCDADGHVYISEAPDVSRLIQPFLIRLAPNGKRTAVYTIAKDPDLREAWVLGTQALVAGGEAIMLAKGEAGAFLVRFHMDGTIAERRRLPFELGISRVAVFPTGEIIIVSKEADRTVVRILSDDDREGRTVNLLSSSPGAGGHVRYDFSDVLTDADGSAYILSNDERGNVTVLDRRGQTLKRFLVYYPAASARPLNMQVANGRVAILFTVASSASSFVVIQDSKTGAVLNVIDTTALGSAFACYNQADRQLEFLGVGNNQMRLLYGRF